MNLALAKKSMFTILFILVSLNIEIPLKGIFNPKFLNNLLASWCLKNLDFTLSHTAQFDKNVDFALFVCATLGFLLFVFFLHFKKYQKLFHKYIKIFDELLKLLDFWFLEILLVVIFSTSVFINFILADDSFAKDLQNLETCLSVNKI